MLCNHSFMVSDSDLPQQPDTLQQQKTRSSKQLKLLALIVAVLLSTMIAGTDGYLLGRRSNHYTQTPTLTPNATATLIPTNTPNQTPTPTIEQIRVSPSLIPPISYPNLYPKVQWGKPYAVLMRIYAPNSPNKDSNGFIFFNNAYETDSNIISWDTQTWLQWAEGVTLYYQKELTSAGWQPYKLDNATGSGGAEEEWTKNGHYFRVGWKGLFNNGTRNTDKQIGLQLYEGCA